MPQREDGAGCARFVFAFFSLTHAPSYHATIARLEGHVVEFCLDQNGSRFIQQRLEVADPVEKGAVMDEVLPAVTDLQNDVFGNYVVQKLFEFGTEDMKSDLKGTLEGNMLSLSLQMYG